MQSEGIMNVLTLDPPSLFESCVRMGGTKERA